MLNRAALLPLVGCLFAACIVRAQTGVGQIQGSVRDASGAVIPGARVALEHAQTGNKYQSKSSEAGAYVFPALQTGDYNLTVSSAGMDTWQGKVVLQVGQQAVVDVALKIAGVAGQVTVAGDVTPLITTTDPTIATVVER